MTPDPITIRVRFAPESDRPVARGQCPDGAVQLAARARAGGTFVLRIEDTDVERSTRESERAIVEDLQWMGLDWDEGREQGGEYGPYRQSERLPVYRAHIVELLSRGLAYRCFCLPEQLEMDRYQALRERRPPKYVGRCRDLPPEQAKQRVENGEPAAIRFRIPENREVVFNDLVRGEVRFDTDVVGDPVLMRSGGIPAYNYAVVIDDAFDGDYARGSRRGPHLEHAAADSAVRGLRLDASRVCARVHGARPRSCAALQAARRDVGLRVPGAGLPARGVDELPCAPGVVAQGEEIVPLAELARRFRIEDVGHSAGVFDPEKLAWMNRHYLKAAAPDRLVTLALPYLKNAGWVTEPADSRARLPDGGRSGGGRLRGSARPVPARLRFLFDYSADRALEDTSVRSEAEAARPVIAAFAEVLAGTGPLIDREAFRAAVAQVKERTGQKGKALLHPIRLALTGEPEGLELDLAGPAIERGAAVADDGIRRIPSAAERAVAFRDAVDLLVPRGL